MVKQIWVYSDNPALLAELVSAGKQVGPVQAIVTGERSRAETAARLCPDGVWWTGETKPGWSAEDYIPTLEALIRDHSPDAILISSNRSGKAIAARLAARLGKAPINDILNFIQDGEGLVVEHMVLGGAGIRRESVPFQTAVLTIPAGVFPPAFPDNNPAGKIRQVELVEPEHRAILVERKTLPAKKSRLDSASKVITAGRGIQKQEDLVMLQELASLLDAELACTRPLAEGLNWLSRERFLGISGATIRPDLYLGVGVSGQIQHMIGASGARVIAAVNQDPQAPIFSQADYIIQADLYVFIPALIKALRELNLGTINSSPKPE